MLEMFETEFMQRAWLAGLIVAVICPLIGSFLVLRRQSMIGDGLAARFERGSGHCAWGARDRMGTDQAGGLFRDDFSNFLLQWDRAGSCFYEYEPYGRV